MLLANPKRLISIQRKYSCILNYIWNYTVNCYLEGPLSSNGLQTNVPVPRPFSFKFALKNNRYLEPRYLEPFAISNQIFVPSGMFSFCPLSRTLLYLELYLLIFVFVVVSTQGCIHSSRFLVISLVITFWPRGRMVCMCPVVCSSPSFYVVLLWDDCLVSVFTWRFLVARGHLLVRTR